MYFKQDTAHIALALGAGTLGSIDRTGELVVVTGKAYVKPSDRATGYELETSTRVVTPFCFGLEQGAETYRDVRS